MAKTYYSGKEIQQRLKNNNIYSSNYPTQRLMQNNYVHTGIYNFVKIAKQQDKALPISELKNQMLKKFNEEIAKSITRENEIYKLRGITNSVDLQESLALSSLGEKVWDNLNLYNLIDDLIDKVAKENNINNTEGKISAEKFNSELQNLFNERIRGLKKDYDEIYSFLFDAFTQNNFIKTKAKEDVYLNTLKEKPLAYFSNLSNYQGAVGEFATLLDSVALNSVDENKIVTELFKDNFNNKNIKVVAPQGKSDISINSIGISVKNYRVNEQNQYNVSLHSGKSLKETFEKDFSEITDEQNFDLQKILQDNNYNWDIKNYFSYMFSNLYAFKNVGGYETVQDRQKGTNAYTKKNLFSQYSFITDFLKFSTLYWIGEKLLQSYSKKNQNTDSVAFLTINKKMIPVSKILIAIRDDLGTAVPELDFSGSVKFNPNVIRQQKYKVIRELKKQERKNWFEKRYPDQLLQIGSTTGNLIINQVKFGIRLKIDYNAF